MANPEKSPDTPEGELQLDSLNCEDIELVSTECDTTIRPMRESLRKLLRPPYNGQPFPPEILEEIERMGGSATEGDITDFEGTDTDSTD